MRFGGEIDARLDTELAQRLQAGASSQISPRSTLRRSREPMVHEVCADESARPISS